MIESDLSRSKLASGIKVPDSDSKIVLRSATDPTFGVMRRSRLMLSRAFGLSSIYNMQWETVGNEMREMASYTKGERSFPTARRMLLTRVFIDKKPMSVRLFNVFVD